MAIFNFAYIAIVVLCICAQVAPFVDIMTAHLVQPHDSTSSCPSTAVDMRERRFAQLPFTLLWDLMCYRDDYE
jgi:hypothetical protein